MQQYFSNKRENNILFLESYDLNHIKNVMRMKKGDDVIVAYDGRSYMCSLNEDLLSCSIKEIYKDVKEREIVAYIPVLQEEKMSFVIEKGTEMGVTTFIPVEFSQCKFKLKSDMKAKKLIRWQRIAKEASEQSRRVNMPIVEDFVSVKNINIKTNVNVLCSTDNEDVKHISEVLTKENICDTISLIFGPEGGISKDEENILINKGFTKTTLGSRILRTETVIIFLTSIIEYLGG